VAPHHSSPTLPPLRGKTFPIRKDIPDPERLAAHQQRSNMDEQTNV
jgi:hypothetical protein